MQMLHTFIDVYSRKEDVLRTEHHCSRLTEVYRLIEEINFDDTIEADSLSWTDSLKRLTDNVIEADSLCDADYLDLTALWATSDSV